MISAQDRRLNLTGHGLVQPLRRLSGIDFVAASGASLIKSAIGQVMGTKRGELPWNPRFGLDVERYRHGNLPETTRDVINEAITQRLGTEVAATLTDWDSRIDVLGCVVTKVGPKLACRVSWTIKAGLESTNRLSSPQTIEVLV